MKKSSNRVLIEHVGTATIYFDRDADRFVVDSASHGKSYAALSSARAWARRVGGNGPTLNIPVVICGSRHRSEDAPAAVTLVASSKWAGNRVVHQDGTSESVPRWRKVLLRKPSTLRTVTRLKAELEAAEKAGNEAQKALDAYLKENAIPGSLEELVAISRPVKLAKGPRS